MEPNVRRVCLLLALGVKSCLHGMQKPAAIIIERPRTPSIEIKEAPSEEMVCRRVMRTFEKHSISEELIMPHLMKFIREANNSPAQEDLDMRRMLHRIESGEHIDKDNKAIHALMLSAVTEALKHQQQESEKHKKETGKWNDKRVAMLVGLGATVCSTITGLVINFTGKDCSK